MKKILTLITVFAIVLSIFMTIIPLAKSQTEDWSEPQQLTTDPADEYYASIMQDSTGKIWLVWVREEPSGRALWYRTSSDGGTSWSTSERLKPDMALIPTISGTSLLQDSSGRIWVAWGGGPKFSQDIFYITSDDGGLSWSGLQQLTNYPGDDNIPSFVEVSGEVWIVFRSYGLSHNEDIWYRKTNDGGANWSPPTRLTFEGRNYCPDALVDSTGKIWVVWARKAHGIYYKTSIDNGTSWSPDQQPTTHYGHPTIIEDVSGKIFIFYKFSEDRPTADIWYRTTVDSGSTWSDYEELTADAYNNQSPYAALINNEIWVVWTSDKLGNFDIWVTKLAPEEIPATVDIHPDTLNLMSRGKWITAYIELPEGYNVSDIDVSTLLLNGTVPAELYPTEVGDYDNDTVPDLMVKFDRANVIEYILNTTTLEPDKFMKITLTVTGKLYDGIPFEGSDIIRVIIPALIGRGWGLMRITPEECVCGCARLFKMEGKLIQLTIIHEDEEYSRTWNIITHQKYKCGERYLCYSSEWGYLTVGIHKGRLRLWWATGRGVLAFGPPRCGRLVATPI